MQSRTRREFLGTSVAASVAAGLTGLSPFAIRLKAASPNEEIGIGVIGLGGVDVVGGVGGRGRQLIDGLRHVPGARIVAICDVDQAVLDHGLQPFKERNEQVAAYTDLRKLLDDASVDAVAIATPNHWHALATIWACQAGKDVYVEKPFSYNIWEGRQMVAAARQFGRMVQVGTQRRSRDLLPRVFEYIRSGALGSIRCAHAIIYRARDGMGRVTSPLTIPSTVNFDLWSGPAPKTPLMRNQLHYEWHWFWGTGNGEIGNNGVHTIDVARWALGQQQAPPRALSIGGRFGFQDGGETPNTQIAPFDYQPAPLICEIRNFVANKKADAIGRFRNLQRGVVIDCEGGYFAGDTEGGAVFDKQDRQVQDFRLDRKRGDAETTAHLANFLNAVRSRSPRDLHAEALEGHLSATCAHMANTSYRLGERLPPQAIQESVAGNAELADAFERCRDYLRSNNVDLTTTQAAMGPWVTLDPQQERFVGDFADEANQLSRRPYREPFVVPQLVS